MTIDFVLVPATDIRSTTTAVSSSFFFDPSHVRGMLASAADSGISAVLIDDAGGPLTNVYIAANVAQWNSDLDVILTHWADVMSPVIAASDFAALDRMTGGRLSLRILTGDTEADGHLRAWQRTDEYLTLLKRLWCNDHPIDHEGPFYSLKRALVADKGLRGHDIPIRMSGLTGTAIDIAARHATVFELPQTTPDGAASLIDRVLAAAARYGRSGKITFAARLHADDGWSSGRSQWLPAYLSAGVTEFMVSGLHDAAALERFGADIIAPLRPGTAQQTCKTPHLVSTSLAMGLF